MNSNNAKARAIVSANRYMSLATSAEGKTWIAPVAYACDEHFNFYWYSEKTAEHSQHIGINQHVAVAIFDSRASSDEVDGLQIIGIASEVVVSDVPVVAELYYAESFEDETTRARWRKSAESFIGEAPLRFYKMTPLQVYKCDTENTSVDRRILVDLVAD